MIDPTTGWFEIENYKNKQAATVLNLVYQLWLCRYPQPTIITYNIGNKLLGHALKT